MEWWQKYKNIRLVNFLEILVKEEWDWAIKRLAGNDTGLTGGHQSGLYWPRIFFERAFPEIVTTESHNPRSEFEECYFACSDYLITTKVQAVYYNSKYFPEKGLKKKYDEFRLTAWGGRECPLQNPENTGAIILLAWKDKKAICWLAEDEQETVIENWIGKEVEPGQFGFSFESYPKKSTSIDIESIIPEEWYVKFPTGREIAELVFKTIPAEDCLADNRIVKRRLLESDIFYEIERRHVEPIVTVGFHSVKEFADFANSFTNRRKSRSGRSLELHLSKIFIESGLQFIEQPKLELAKNPDFLFPSVEAYNIAPQPGLTLFMLASKTCCKERWRQVIPEVDPKKIPERHLFTLQEGFSENQIAQMKDVKIFLVIPETNRRAFSKSSRKWLINLQNFIKMVTDSQTQ